MIKPTPQHHARPTKPGRKSSGWAGIPGHPYTTNAKPIETHITWSGDLRAGYLTGKVTKLGPDSNDVARISQGLTMAGNPRYTSEIYHSGRQDNHDTIEDAKRLVRQLSAVFDPDHPLADQIDIMPGIPDIGRQPGQYLAANGMFSGVKVDRQVYKGQSLGL